MLFTAVYDGIKSSGIPGKVKNMKRNIAGLIVLLSLIAFSPVQAAVQVGDKAPDFSGTADDGSVWKLADHLGQKYVVVYFYPAAMTGGCTAQACAYRDFQNDIQDADALVVGVSGDKVEGLKVFKQAHDLNFALLSDENGSIAGKFGVPAREGGTLSRELGGKLVELSRGVTLSRWTFIISPEGKVIYKNEEVNPERDTAEVLSFIRKQKASR